MKPSIGGRSPVDLTIRRCKIHDCSLKGPTSCQAVSISCNSFLIEENEFYDNVDIAVDLWFDCCYGSVRYNDFYTINTTRNQGTGIYLDNAHDIKIYGNLFRDNYFTDGVCVATESGGQSGSYNVYVFSNVFLNMHKNAMSVWISDTSTQTVTATYFYNNTCVNCNKCWEWGSLNNNMITATFANNIGFYTSNVGGNYGPGTYNVTLTNNYSALQTNTSGGAAVYLVNPALRPSFDVNWVPSANGFELKSGTNARVNAGVAFPAAMTPAQDFAKRTRTVGIAPDQGALERQS